jgi:hypothetical protein
MAYVYNPDYLGSRDQRTATPDKEGRKGGKEGGRETLSQKYPKQKRTDKVAQVVEHLSSKCEVLSSNSSSQNRK